MKGRLPWWSPIVLIVVLAIYAVVVAASLPANPRLAEPLAIIGFVALVVLYLRGQIVRAWPVTAFFAVLVVVPDVWLLLF